MRTALIIAAAALALAACSKHDTTAANPQGSGEGMAYNPTTNTTTQADATPGSLRTGTMPDVKPPLNPDATTGASAGGVTQKPPTAPNTPADGRVDH